MNIRKLLISCVLLIGCYIADARMPDSFFFNRFRIGVEWGVSPGFLLDRNYNIITGEGYRLHEKYCKARFHANGALLANIGFQVGERVLLAVYGGYIGAGEDNRMLPLLLRASYYPNSVYGQGFFSYLQAGPAWRTVNIDGGRPVWLACIGEGYRIPLSSDINLDVLISFRYTRDHPPIPNPEGPGYVTGRNVRMNYAGYYALDFSLAINF